MSLRIDPADLEPSRDRYHRQSLIPWWDQERVRGTKLLVIGAGALGNEVLKNLALLGAGRVLVYDMDRIERSNLNRSVLFTEADEGRPKAEVAAAAMRRLNPDVRARGINANANHRAGLGVFLWADVVVCAVDNREARIFVNGASARTKRTWVDGAIEGFSGIVRAFRPHDSVCYECTMNEVDRRQVAERRSCAMLARDVVAHGHVPATPTTASLIGALQAQEAVKILHGQPALIGEGVHIDGLYGQYDRVAYPRRDDCYGHEALDEVVPLGVGTDEVTLRELLETAERTVGPDPVLELSREVVTRLTCPECEGNEEFWAALGAVTEREAACPDCGAHRVVHATGVVTGSSDLDLERTLVGIGVPPFDIVVARSGMERRKGWLLDGDAAAVLGDLMEGEAT